MQVTLPPLFFSSIPKCGKNVIYSFFFSLGYKRFKFSDDVYNNYSNLYPFRDLQGRDHYLTERGADCGKNHEQAACDFKKDICSIPAGYIGHRHMHPDQILLDALKEAGIKPMFIYRDPRSCLVSAVHWAAKGKPEHVSRLLDGLPEEDAILALLSGNESLVPFALWFDAYRPWLGVPETIDLRFEDIIGARGGGNNAKQRESLKRAIHDMGINVPTEIFESALTMAFNPRAGTFRSGQIGEWKQSFSLKVTQEFERNAGHLLGLWGFSHDK